MSTLWMNGWNRLLFAADGGGGSEAPAAPSGGGGDSGGSAGSPSGSEAAPPASSPGTSEAGPDWSALGSTDDLDYAAAVTPPETPPAEPVVPPPSQVPPQAAPQQPAAPTPGEARGEARPTTPPQASGEAAPLTASDPWRIAEGLEANREAVIAHLATAKFALSEEDIRELDTDVTTAVPKLLARVFLESQVSMQKFLAQAVPGMVKRYNSVSGANDAAERQFFDQFPALDRNNPQHREATVRIASIYRQANPNIPLAQLISEVGPMVMNSLQIVPGAAHGRAKPRVQGFVPAVNGGGGLSPTPEPPNEWEGLGRNYD